jgi:hypothetical protein
MTHIATTRDLYTPLFRVDNENNSYIFGFKRGGIWSFVPYRFILSGHNTNLYGQFISSTWFNHSPDEENVEYIILGINKSFKYSDIAQAINSVSMDDDTLNISQRERGLGVTFKENFTISMDAIRETINKETVGKLIKTRDIKSTTSTVVPPKKIFCTTFRTKGRNTDSLLSLSINKLTGGVINITLPSFTLKPT